MNVRVASSIILGLGLAACAGTPPSTTPTAAAPPPPAADPMPTVDYAQIARRIVVESAGVKAGEIVRIDGAARDAALMERLAVEVLKAGAHPVVMLDSERVGRAYYAEVDAKYDSQPRRGEAGLARLTNVHIQIDTGETEGLFSDVPRERVAAVGKSFEPISAIHRERKVRQVSVSNELYPTAWRARRHNVPLPQFATMFWNGVNVDYTELQVTGEKARAALTGKALRVTHPNGTDLTMSVKGRPVIVSDGIVTAADVGRGALDAFLPAGEVMVAPVPGTGEGRYVVDKLYFGGREVTGLTMRFEKGKLVEMTGNGPGFALLKADYDARGAGKEKLGYFDLGINPSYVLPQGNALGNWISAGMVTVGTGFNLWAGGDNGVSAGVAGHLGGCTVTIDDRTIVDKGVLKL